MEAVAPESFSSRDWPVHSIEKPGGKWWTVLGALYGVIARLVSEAEPYYASARIGLAALPYRAAWSIAAALRIYRAIGLRIRAGGPDAYRRLIGTGKAAKVAMIAAAKGDAIRSRGAPPDLSRAGLWTRPR